MKVTRKYSCVACGGSVAKYIACGLHKDGKKEDYAGLHGWRCNAGCKPCIVKVTLEAAK